MVKSEERRATRMHTRMGVTMGALLLGVALSAQAPVVIERTLALVGGQIITLGDVRAATALGLVDLPVAEDPVALATERLIERTLMLREVERYAPGEPSEAAIEARLAEVRGRYETPLALTGALEAGGFTPARLRAWIRDDLRVASYLEQRFAAAGVPTDQDIGAYYSAHREEFEESGVPFEEIAPLVRARLAGERRRELIVDWVEGLRRRTEIVALYRRP